MPRAGAGKYRVTELDRLYTGKPLLTALGPVSFSSDAELAEALNRIAADGPYTRVGLSSTRESRRWRITDSPGEAVVLPACTDGCTTMTEVMASMERVRPTTSVAFWRCGEYVCCYFDHGVADAYVIMRVMDALTEHAPQPGIELAGREITTRPLALALWSGLRSNRPAFLSGVRDVFRAVGTSARASRSSDVEHAAAPQATQQAPVEADDFSRDELTFVFISSPANYLEQLRKYRDALHPGVTTTALVAYWMCRDLCAAGVKLAHNVEFTTDFRRFLPPDRITHNNFIGVVEVPFSTDITPEQFSDSLKAESATYAGLLKLQILLVLNKIQDTFGRGSSRGVQPAPSTGDQTTLTITDATKSPPKFEIHYSDPSRAEWACFINPETRNHLALLWSPVPGHIQVTARFSGRHIDRDVVRAALTKALDMEHLSHL